MKRMLILVILISLIRMGFPVEANGVSENLLINGDFSQVEKGLPVGWKAVGNAYCKIEGAKMEIVYDKEIPFVEGFPVVKITKYTPPGGKSLFRFGTEPFPVQPGATYRFSIWLRADTPLVVSFAFDNSTEELIKKMGKEYKHWWSRPEGKAVLTEMWQEYSYTVRIPGPGDPDYTPLEKVWIWIDSENGTYWAAKASVVKVEE